MHVPPAVLEPAPRYFPIAAKYTDRDPQWEIAKANFGNGVMDRRLHQIDATWPEVHAQKLRGRANINDCVGATDEYAPAMERAVTEHFLRVLPREYPNLFRTHVGARGTEFIAYLTGDRWLFRGGKLVGGTGHFEPVSGLDAIAMNIQEDIGVMHLRNDNLDDEQGNALVAGHVLLPSHWVPAQKLGLSFKDIHDYIPIMKDNFRGQRMTHRMVYGPEQGHFVAGIDIDHELQHLDVNDQLPVAPWQAYELNFERQIWTGKPEERIVIFIVGKRKLPFKDFRAPEHRTAASYIRSIPPHMLTYKRLSLVHEDLPNQLDRVA